MGNIEDNGIIKMNKDLIGNKVKLTHYEYDDFNDYFKYIMDDDVKKKLCIEINNVEEAKLTFKWLMDNREFIKISEIDNDIAIGHIVIHPCSSFINDFDELNFLKNRNGISLSFAISKEFQNNGLMTEALKLLINHLFKKEIDFIDCENLKSNKASYRVQEKLGFKNMEEVNIDGEDLLINVLKKE